MVQKSLDLVSGALSAAVGWFDACIGSVDGAGYIIAVVFMVLAYKFILSPVLGEGGSDIADVRAQQKRERTAEQVQFAQQFKR